MRYVALLRGINVGGHRKVPMARLRSVVESLGFDGVETLLQSGNVVFAAPPTPAEDLASTLAGAIEAKLGFPVPVFIRTGPELDRVIAANPFPQGEQEPKLLHVAFSSVPVRAEALAGIDPARFTPDQFRSGRDEVYLWFPNGSGRSKLTIGPFEKALGANLTARNWNTVLKLRDLTSD